MSHFLYQLRRVKAKDIAQVWKLPVALACMPFYKRKHKDLWIVCEDKNEARDNGYWFYKYVREEHPEQDCLYAISGKSPDVEKIKALGPWVEYGTLKHWIAYLASSKKISSQKAGNPNAAIFYALEVYGLLKDKRIFLQHGITINDQKWLYYEATRMWRFICGARPEYEFVESVFGYPRNCVEYTGFCRFDNLHNVEPDPKLVLVMPTWREWIADEDYRLEQYEGTTVIAQTDYFKRWSEFLASSELKRMGERYDVRFVFYPHRNMQKYMEYFPTSNEYLQVADASAYDIQDLLKQAALMVTDYSSVFMDFVYMKKPVVFYQFDYGLFRKAQYSEGYFDYRNNAFGPSMETLDEVMRELEKYLAKGCAVSEEFLREHGRYFPLYDSSNCERVYNVVRDA